MYAFEYLDEFPKRIRAQSMLPESDCRRVNVGVQSIIPPRQYISPLIASSHKLSQLDFPKFLYMPHTILFLVIGIGLLLSQAFASNEEDLPFMYYFKRYLCCRNYKNRGLLAAVAVIMFYGAVYLPDTILNRPHPILWRLIQAAGLAYLLFVVFILFMVTEPILMLNT